MSGNTLLSREEAVELLAKTLYIRMEKMDPGGSGLWSDLSDSEREFYRASIEAILLEKTLLSFAIDASVDSSP